MARITSRGRTSRKRIKEIAQRPGPACTLSPSYLSQSCSWSRLPSFARFARSGRGEAGVRTSLKPDAARWVASVKPGGGESPRHEGVGRAGGFCYHGPGCQYAGRTGQRVRLGGNSRVHPIGPGLVRQLDRGRLQRRRETARRLFVPAQLHGSLPPRREVAGIGVVCLPCGNGSSQRHAHPPSRGR